MKKSVLSILTFCFVFIGMLAFSCPVFAKQSFLLKVDESQTFSSPTFYVSASADADKFTIITNSGSAYYNTIPVFIGDSGDGFIDIPMGLYALAGNKHVTMNGMSNVSVMLGNIKLSYAWDSGSSSRPNISIYATSLILAGKESFINRNAYVEGIFNVQDINSFTLTNIISLRVYFHFNAATYVENNAVLAEYGLFHFSFTAPILYIVGSDDTSLVTSSDLSKQTDQLTNGYDNSSMSSDNTRLNDQISQYDQAQESATNTSVSNIDAAEFINPSSNASVFAAMTFSASFLQSLYNNLGDFGIVVMVSLSLCLGLMLVGWFKYRKGG